MAPDSLLLGARPDFYGVGRPSPPLRGSALLGPHGPAHLAYDVDFAPFGAGQPISNPFKL